MPMKRGLKSSADEIRFVVRSTCALIIKGHITCEDISELRENNSEFSEYLNRKYPKLSEKLLLKRYRDILRNYSKDNYKVKQAKSFSSCI